MKAERSLKDALSCCREYSKHNPISISPPLFLDDEEKGQRVIVGVFSPVHPSLCLDLSPDEYLAFIETVVKSNDIRVIVHDLKSFLKPYYEKFGAQGFTGVSLSRFSCTYILSYLLDPPERIEGEIIDSIETSLLLENLALKHLGEAYPRLEAWLWDKDPDEAIYLRLLEDARYIYRLWDALENKLKGSPPDGPDLLKLYEDVERPLILALLDMECRGIRVNQARAARILPHLEKVLEILKEKIPAKAKSIFANGNAEANEEELESPVIEYAPFLVNKEMEHGKASQGLDVLPVKNPKSQRCLTG